MPKTAKKPTHKPQPPKTRRPQRRSGDSAERGREDHATSAATEPTKPEPLAQNENYTLFDGAADLPVSAERWQACLDAAKRCRELENALAAAAIDLKAAKARHNDAQEQLNAANAEHTALTLGKPIQAAFFNGADDPKPGEAWRGVPIAELSAHGLKQSTIAKLADNGVENMGQLVDWQEKHGRITQMKGVGPKAEAEIEEALTQFWAANPSYCKPMVKGEVKPDDGEEVYEEAPEEDDEEGDDGDNE